MADRGLAEVELLSRLADAFGFQQSVQDEKSIQIEFAEQASIDITGANA